jgi:hypothetical protein
MVMADFSAILRCRKSATTGNHIRKSHKLVVLTIVLTTAAICGNQHLSVDILSALTVPMQLSNIAQ